eukprot:Seg1951.8 transcript_id=Seg1951.8/GoldUCD/mRNA.D3Y31 product="Na+/H+ exchange regulatory cofactor NHE-RF2" protein_id=Seg1951.8/GoldUCD/D3Y31
MDDKGRTVKAPRLVEIKKNEKGFGFNLHGERGVVGQFISAVDDGGPAHKAGLCTGDRVVEVNGVNVEAATHGQVVTKIKESGGTAILLVVDKVTDDYMKQHGILITSDLAKLETVIKVEESSPKVEVQPEEEINNDGGKSTNGKESEPEETGMSIEDYLKMAAAEGEGKQEGHAEAQQEVTATETVQKEEANVQQTEVVVEEAKSTNEEAKSTERVVEENGAAEPVVEEPQKAEPKQKMTPPTDPPPTPPSEPAPTPPSEPAPTPPSEPAPAPPSQPSPAAPEQVPNPAKEPEPVKVPEEPAAKTVEPKFDMKAKMAAALPKSKRKEMKEKKGSDWASRAAIFNNL